MIFAMKLIKDREEVEALRAGDGLNLNSFIETIEETLDADFEADLKPWLGLHHGYALLQLEDEEGGENYEHVIFVQSVNRDATLDFLSKFELESHQDSLQTEKYKNYSLYSFAVGQNVNFMILDKYFVFAKEAGALKKIVDVHVGETEALIGSDEYRKVRNNLKKDMGYVYYVPAKVFDYYVGTAPSGSASLIRPILGLFDSQGHSVILDDGALIIQTYMNFSTHGAGEKSLPKPGVHYDAELMGFLPPNFEYFWGSQNISQILSEFGGALNSLHPSSFNILEGILNAKKEQYFGYEADLREDIYKVFENEFALAMYARPDHIDYLFLAENQDREHIAKLEALYLETMTEEGYEILPEEESGQEESGITAFPFDARTNMYTAVQSDKFIMSTDRELVRETIQNIASGTTNGEINEMNKYLKDFDELNIMSPAFMGELLGEKVARYLEAFTRIQAAKSIFPDGMALVHVFEF